MTIQPLTTAVIVTYQSIGEIGDALDGLKPCYEAGLLECVVVDNDSNDGTPEFIAPEQAADGELSAQTDIYQLGVTAFYMLTGQRLFNGSALQVIAKHIGEKPGSAGELIDGLPRNIDAVLHMALAKDPKNRFRTASDFLGALQLLGDQNTVTFQRLPGLPLRAATLASASPVDYQPVIPADAPAAAPSGFASGIVTPSAVPASSTTSRKVRPFVRYALAGLAITVLVIGSIFFIPGIPGGPGGNGGGNGGGRGGNGGGGGQGNGIDNAPTLVEEVQDDTIIVLDTAEDNVVESDVEIVLEPAPTTDLVIDNTDETPVIQVVEAVTDAQLPAPAPTNIGNDAANDTPNPVNNAADDSNETNPQPIAADNDNNGNRNNGDGNGRGGRGDRNNGNGNSGGNDGNGGGRGGNGNGGNNGNGNGQGRGNGGNGGNGGRGGGN